MQELRVDTLPNHDVAREVGDVVDRRYRLLEIIGEGGMGTVYLAEHVLIGRKVALKILHRELAADPEIVARFVTDARAAGTLGNAHIVESTDMGFLAGDVPFVVFEYLDGTPLSSEIYRLGGLSVARALRIAIQIASALEAAHAAGIVHRDLASDNILLEGTGRPDHVTVLDFGSSRATPEFMAPEQVTSPDNVDERADVYALGVVLYEMLAGRTPFVGKGDERVLLNEIVFGTVPALEARVRDLPRDLAKVIVQRLLAKDAVDRYQTINEVRHVLEAFAKRETGSAARRGRSMMWLAGALAAAAASAVLIYRPSREAQQPQPIVISAPRAAAPQPDATIVDGAAAAAQLRAEGFASNPMLRAAIETDTATLADMVRDGLFTLRAGESLEIFQLRDGTLTSLLRVPANAPPIAPVQGGGTRVDKSGGNVRLVATAPIARQRGDVGGSIAIAVPVVVATPKLAPNERPKSQPVALAARSDPTASPLVGYGCAGTSLLLLAVGLLTQRTDRGRRGRAPDRRSA